MTFIKSVYPWKVSKFIFYIAHIADWKAYKKSLSSSFPILQTCSPISWMTIIFHIAMFHFFPLLLLVMGRALKKSSIETAQEFPNYRLPSTSLPSTNDAKHWALNRKTSIPIMVNVGLIIKWGIVRIDKFCPRNYLQLLLIRKCT